MTAPDLDALIADLKRDAKAWAGSVGPTPRLEREAAIALAQLRERVADLEADRKMLNQQLLLADRRGDSAEAEVEERNAAYVAALSPERVLAMIACIEAAKAMRDYAGVMPGAYVFDATLAALEKLNGE